MRVYGEKISNDQITHAMKGLLGAPFTFGDLKRQLAAQGIENVNRCGDRVLRSLKAQKEITFYGGKWNWIGD